MIDWDLLVEGTVVAWQGPNGWVRGVVEVMENGEGVLALENGMEMDLDVVVDVPSSKILGHCKKNEYKPNNTKCL